MTPFPLRRVIDCAKRLMTRQGFDRRRAIRAALLIVARNPEAPAPIPAQRRSTQNAAHSEAALEYLTHRNRTMAHR